MYNKVKSIIYFLVFISFFILFFVYYFSEENKDKIYKNRNNNPYNFEEMKIPLLKNNTDMIIEYNSSDFDKKKIKKRFFWQLLKKD